MELTFEELYKFAKANMSQIYGLDGSLNEDYILLSKKVNEAAANNNDYMLLINKLRQATTEYEINQLRELFKSKFEKKEKTEEEIISEVYGISLDNIEHFRLKNGKEYYKFYDIKQNKDFILEQNNENKNLSEEFKEIQEEVLSTQKYNSTGNAEEVFKYQRMHTNNEVALYSPNDLEVRPELLNDLTKEEMKALYILLKNKDALRIRSINPKLGIVIDEDHKVISAAYDEARNEYDITYPEGYKYSNDVDYTNQQGNVYEIEIDNDIEISDDIPEIIEEVEIDPEKVKFLYEYPEALEREEFMTPKEKQAYIIALDGYKKTVEKRNGKNKGQKPKIYTKKKDDNIYRNAGFMDVVLLAILTGFAGGVITMVVLNIIK